jgi:hypothetical protein
VEKIIAGGVQYEGLIEKPWPLSHWISNSDLATLRTFPARSLFLLLLPLVITFLHPIVILFTSTPTNERLNEQTNERTVTRPLSRHVHLLLTITNFLPFASFLLLLTVDRLQR